MRTYVKIQSHFMTIETHRRTAALRRTEAASRLLFKTGRQLATVGSLPPDSVPGAANHVSFRRRRLIEADHQHAAAEQGDAAGTAVVAGVAVLEVVGAADAHGAVAVAAQADPSYGDGVVEQQQMLRVAGGLGSRDGRFARFEAVEPEPTGGGQQHEAEEVEKIHAVSLPQICAGPETPLIATAAPFVKDEVVDVVFAANAGELVSRKGPKKYGAFRPVFFAGTGKTI